MNVIVTGASRGIGRELSIQLAKQGHNVLALSRNKEELDKLAADFESIRAGVLDLDADVSGQLGSAMDDVGFEHVDILVNNAGHLVNKPFSDLTAEDIRKCYQVNILGVMTTTQIVLHRMRSGAHVVNISSMGGFQGSAKFPGLSAYSSSKAAVASLTECLAEEYKESGIRFNCLALGAVQTEMLEEAFPGYEAPTSASEMAGFIADFCLNGSKSFNGKILPVSISTP